MTHDQIFCTIVFVSSVHCLINKDIVFRMLLDTMIILCHKLLIFPHYYYATTFLMNIKVNWFCTQSSGISDKNIEIIFFDELMLITIRKNISEVLEIKHKWFQPLLVCNFLSIKFKLLLIEGHIYTWPKYAKHIRKV